MTSKQNGTANGAAKSDEGRLTSDQDLTAQEKRSEGQFHQSPAQASVHEMVTPGAEVIKRSAVANSEATSRGVVPDEDAAELDSSAIEIVTDRPLLKRSTEELDIEAAMMEETPAPKMAGRGAGSHGATPIGPLSPPTPRPEQILRVAVPPRGDNGVPGAMGSAESDAGPPPVPLPRGDQWAEPLQPRPRKRGNRPWFEEVFDEDYLRTLPFLTPGQTLREAEFISDELGLPTQGQVLDLCCGYGRHAIEFAQRGYRVTGVDLSLSLLIRAADETQRRGLKVNFAHADVREINFDRRFDGAYCTLTSFGYFDEETNLQVLKNVCRSLKPGARLLLETINRDYIVPQLPTRVWWEGNGCVVLEEVDYAFETNRVLLRRSIVYRDGRQVEQELSIRSYTMNELGRVFRQAGFRVRNVSGSYATPGRFFGATSRNLIFTAERINDVEV